MNLKLKEFAEKSAVMANEMISDAIRRDDDADQKFWESHLADAQELIDECEQGLYCEGVV